MEKIGVISPVKEPTQWCAGMVIVPKPSGSIHICIDLKPLNESVMRAVYLIRSYGAPNGAERCSVAQCRDYIWAMLVQSKIELGQYCNVSSTIGCWQLENVYQYINVIHCN